MLTQLRGMTESRLFLREWRRYRGLTQTHLAQRTGWEQAHLSRIETGRGRWNRDILAALASALDCSPADLLTRNPLAPEDESADPLLQPAPNSAGHTRRPPIIFVPQPAASPSAGDGSFLTGEEVVAWWPFAVDWLRSLGVSTNLAALVVRGDSMAPTLPDGALILIDLDDRNPANPAIYCLWDDALLVNRLVKTGPNELRVQSDNPVYPPYSRAADGQQIIGRVVWCGRKL